LHESKKIKRKVGLQQKINRRARALAGKAVTNCMEWVYVDGKRTERAKLETVELKAVCGPGDTPAPVITIMLPNED
jgi:hypothetical protein